MSYGIRPFWQKVYSGNVHLGNRIQGYDRKPLDVHLEKILNISGQSLYKENF